MKKILDFLFSTRLMSVLFLVFAASMAIATFIENDFGTPTAYKLVYATWWFEGIMLIFVINFVGNIFRYRLFRKEKWPVLLFHLAFILILVGAWVTRYISYEGIMPILEGTTTNKILTDKVYFSIADASGKDLIVKKILMGKMGSNYFKAQSEDGSVTIEFDEFIPNAKQVMVAKDGAPTYLHLVEQSGGKRHDHFIQKDSVIFIHGVPVSFNDNLAIPGIHLFDEDGQMKIKAPMPGSYMVMATQATGEIAPDSIYDFNLRALYTLGSIKFVVPGPPASGDLIYQSDDPNYFPKDLVAVNLTANGETKRVEVVGGKFFADGVTKALVGGEKYKVSYGSRYIELPFALKLRDFQLDRYPGSKSPMSYASEVTVIDDVNNKKFDFRIFMNNILTYQGYKFFQSSYAMTPAGEETRLSVNHDSLGTFLTYVGYTLLYLGLLLILFLPGTRFSDLRHKLRKLRAKQVMILLLLGLSSQTTFAQGQSHSNDISIDTFLQATAIPESHAEIFGRLVVQDAGGRMKPVNTFSSELLRKLTKHDTYHGFNADQVLASIVLNPRAWYYAPIIYMKRENKKVRKIIGVDEGDKYARLIDFFDEKGGYKLLPYVEEASKKRIPGAFDKSVVLIDQRVNLLYGVLEQERGLRFFPANNDPNNKWYSAMDAPAAFHGSDSVFVANIFTLYAQSMMEGKASGNDSLAVALLNGIHKFQKTYGAAVLPSQKQIDLEIKYNKYDIFKKLFSYYMYIGTLLFFFVIFQLFKDSKVIRWLINISMVIILILFAMHTAGLGVRWYISGHTPWSNAYESMIYVAWATMLFGLLFGRKSALTMGATAFLTSMMLMIAHWSWMDPAIENLVPVLNSYWLMIHVSIIVASYGPFALSMILGIVALLFMVLTNDRNKSRLAAKIKEITYINEMSMTVGLVMLTIGNFLGGQWANESWGRYWGWDPKETWALISIMVYAFILHARLVPGLRSRFTFNMFSIFGFASIIMTYFGVNFYLAGLHSYAKGDPPPTPSWIYYFLGLIVALSVAAYMSYIKHYRKSKDE